MLANATTYFAYDHLRADGFMVRWSRLDMVTTNMTAMVALCWIMEVLFSVAYFSEHKRIAAVAFWVAYLTINVMV